MFFKTTLKVTTFFVFVFITFSSLAVCGGIPEEEKDKKPLPLHIVKYEEPLTFKKIAQDFIENYTIEELRKMLYKQPSLKHSLELDRRSPWHMRSPSLRETPFSFDLAALHSSVQLASHPTSIGMRFNDTLLEEEDIPPLEFFLDEGQVLYLAAVYTQMRMRSDENLLEERNSSSRISSIYRPVWKKLVRDLFKYSFIGLLAKELSRSIGVTHPTTLVCISLICVYVPYIIDEVLGGAEQLDDD